MRTFETFGLHYSNPLNGHNRYVAQEGVAVNNPK